MQTLSIAILELKSMECLYTILSIFLFFLSLFPQSTHPQQEYINNAQLECAVNSSGARGYRCNGLQTLCQSFLTFRSQSPYNSAVSIAYLLGSEASTIISINNISSTTYEIPSGKLIIVPVSCSCSGSIYRHITPYTVKSSETYFTIANKTYQGLTTCQAMIGQNYYDTENLTAGLQLVAPLRCACPSANQTANEVTFLLVYSVTWGDTITSIGETFGVSVQMILDANMLSPNPLIYPFTFILVPLDTRNCLGNTGKFFCSCPNGFLANGSFGGLTCISDAKKIPVKLVSLIGVGIGVGFLCLFMSGYQLCQYLTRRRCRIHKQKMFRKNGGLLLKKKFSSLGRIQKATVFTEEALQRATDNYNSNRFLGQGGYGTVYKGMLPDGSIVAVKKSKEIDSSWIEQFINKVFILSQINHRNIVKLLGCCLETEVPLLVYEFVPNGTLSSHIHDQDLESSLSWQNRLRIACEVAGAVAYMHSAASVPIFHRDIKSSNILLDDKYSSRVSDFGTSRSVPLDKSHVTTAVQGTFGYFDPEYFRSSQFTEKSDVYSFGVVLVELLTGEKPITFAGDEELRNLGAHIISSIKEDRLLQILDPRVAKEGDRDEIIAVAALAKRCLRYNGMTRPTMKEVAMELERLRESQTVLQVNRGSQIWSAESSAMDTDAEAEEEHLEDGNVLEIDSASI